MSPTTADHIALIMIWLSAPAQTLFVLIYGTRSPWWRSLLGRALFTKALALALLLDLSLWTRIHPTWPWQLETTLVVIGLVLVGSWMQLSALLVERWRVSRGQASRLDPMPPLKTDITQ